MNSLRAELEDEEEDYVTFVRTGGRSPRMLARNTADLCN